ncbi:MAG: M6 family metalloprotease domain-containing protein [Elusimicrobiota bacterium]
MKHLLKLILFLVLLLSSYLYAGYAPPRPGRFNTEYNNRSTQSNIPQMRTYAIPKKRSQFVSGTLKPLIILIEFSDVKARVSSTTTYFDNMVFSAGGASMNTYYKENSENKMSFSKIGNPNPTLWLTAENTLAYYGADDDNIDERIDELAKTAVIKADNQGVDFSQYDDDGDGYVDYVIIVHAGQAQEYSGVSNDIWSHQGIIPNGYSVDGVKVRAYAMVSEYSPVGVFSHEFGHLLGLPDLYDTATGDTVVATWCLMDLGAWLGGANHDGTNPSHLSVWCKKYLGWISAEEITADKKNMLIYPNAEAEPAGEKKYLKIPILGSNTEYFLVEYRRKTPSPYIFEKNIGGEGILIWHINDSVNLFRIGANKVNVDPDNLGVALISADDIVNVETAEGDPWRKGQIFMSPRSDSSDGRKSNILISNFGIPGNTFDTMDIYIIKMTSNLSINQHYAYPSPSLGPVNFKFISDTNINDGTVYIYNIAGEEIRRMNVNSDNILVNSSKDYALVYDVLWDGYNNNGEPSASGLYLYLLKADNVYVKNKFAIVK